MEQQEKYLNKYRELCGRLCVLPEDYTPKNVRRNNRAQKALASLSAELCAEPTTAAAVFNTLMDDESIAVRKSAAAKALKHGLSVEKAVKTLSEIAEGGDLAAFDAEMVLRSACKKYAPSEHAASDKIDPPNSADL